MTTMDLEEIAEEIIAKRPGRPAFKGYRGYPRAVRVGEQGSRARDSFAQADIAEGDIISLDFGVECDGYYGDAAVTVPVGKIHSGAAEAFASDPGIAGSGH